MRSSKKNGNLLEVLDEDGKLRTDEEAIEVWVRHFSKLLGSHTNNKVDNTTSQHAQGVVQSEYEDRLCQPITMEEVHGRYKELGRMQHRGMMK